MLGFVDLHLSLLSADSEPHPGAEICRQRRVSHDFVVMTVQRVIDTRVGGDSRIDRVPSAQIDACVSGGVVESKAEKVRIRTTAYEAPTEVRAPARSHVGEEDVS